MRVAFLLMIICSGLLLNACSNFVITPDSNQATNNGVDAARVK